MVQRDLPQLQQAGPLGYLIDAVFPPGGLLSAAWWKLSRVEERYGGGRGHRYPHTHDAAIATSIFTSDGLGAYFASAALPSPASPASGDG